ncbi:type II secretion system protein GspL, partial [Ideonella sp.]|uniref:type II secretion system protein GspL n=1 Tax=Ideonella sp. TaxID=1929293 RepID=UPI003BB73C81
MSTLIVQLPAVPRLAAQHADTPPIGDATEFDYLRLGENGQVAAHGRCAVADLPAAHEVVAVLGPADLAWHRPVLPKAPGSRMRQALGGVLEEALLEDDASLHFALAPGASAGQPTWVAALDKGWLQARIAQLEAAGLTVDRVVPGWTPDGPTAGHVFADDRGLQLAWRDAQGPICLPLASSSARALLGQLSPDEPVQWTACPEGAAEAAMLAGAPVAALSQAERLIEAARSAWNLRQFDLQPQRRGQRAAREVLRQAWNDPAWRPARIGLLALVVVQLLGTNLWAWRQRSALDERRLAMNTLLQTTFPQVRAVIDAPAQM